MKKVGTFLPWTTVALSFSTLAAAIVPDTYLPTGSATVADGTMFIAQSDDNGYAITRLGPNLYRFEVRGDDRYPGDARKGRHVRRAEFTQGRPHFRFGDDVWISFSQRIVRMDPTAEDDWVVLGQLHGPNRPELPEDSELLEPPFAMVYRQKDGLRFVSRSGDDRHGQSKTLLHYVQETRLGEWADYVIHIRTGLGDDGILSVWRNGEQIVDYQGPIGYRSGGGRHYWKFGIYENTEEDATRIVEYADMHLG
jgi:hypothetical protein